MEISKEESEPSQVAENLKHHVQLPLCTTRPQYRQGRKLTAVKELTVLCQKFGQLRNVTLAEREYPREEEFTDTFHVHYELIKCARYAKKALDNKEFFGGVLHVCYAPELETVEETLLKLLTRKKEIIYRKMLLTGRTRNNQDGNSSFRKMFGLVGRNLSDAPGTSNPIHTAPCKTQEATTLLPTHPPEPVSLPGMIGPQVASTTKKNESCSLFVPRVCTAKKPRLKEPPQIVFHKK